MYRKLASAVLIASAINAKYALALGLGGMTMHSALNQPLDAEITLSSVGDLDKSQILVTLASPEDYLKAGVDRSFFLFDIKFEVVLDGKGGGVVKLHSTKRLNEPYLDILLEAKWPSGRSLRSYTTLVDLPVYDEAPVAKVDAPSQSSASSVGNNQAATSASSETAQSATRSQQTYHEPPKAQPSRAYKTASNLSGDQYQIQPNETLSRIANKLNPGSGVTLNQTMLAIQKMNPHAFVRNNINLIKAGAVLRVPTAADVKQISTAVAAQAVAEQNREWRGVQLDATDSKEISANQDQLAEDGHLTLTSAGAGLANGKEKATGDTALLQQKLSSSQESLNVTKAENKDLSSRVGALSSEVNQLKRMIELKDAELAALQKKLGKNVTPVAATEKPAVVAPQVKPESVVQEKPVVQPVEPEKAVETKPDASKEAVPNAPAVAEKAIEKPAPKKVPESKAQETPEPGIIDKVKANPLYIGIVALVLIFGVVAFLFRRKAQAERLSVQENDIGNFDFEDAVDHDLALDGFDSQDITDEFEAVSGVDTADVLHEEDEQPTTMQTSDPIGEADIYIAYGRYDQAAELLLNAISKSPNNVDLRSKLLEVYVESKNKAGFQQQYLELRTLGHTVAIGHAKELLSSAEDVSDWLDDLPADEGIASAPMASAPSETAGFEEDLDLDLSLDDSGFDDFASEEKSASDVFDTEEFDVAENSKALEEEIDLSDIDTDFSTDDFEFSEKSVAPEAKDEDGEDFSLDLSDFDLDNAEEDVSFELDTTEESSQVLPSSDASTLDDEMSFELPDDFDLQSGQELENSAEDSLSFDDLDMGFTDSATSSAVLEKSADTLDTDDLSFDSFDLGEELPTTANVVDEEPSLDFSDMDLGLEDGSGLVNADANELEQDFDTVESDFAASLPDESLALESDFEFGSLEEVGNEFEDMAAVEQDVQLDSSVVQSLQQPEVAPVELEVQPSLHVSSPIATLESEDLEFLTDGDEVSTKLDLAQAYVDLGDVDGARDILLEVMKEGRDEQKAEAAALLDSLD